jgi:hypothetical protein
VQAKTHEAERRFSPNTDKESHSCCATLNHNPPAISRFGRPKRPLSRDSLSRTHLPFHFRCEDLFSQASAQTLTPAVIVYGGCPRDTPARTALTRPPSRILPSLRRCAISLVHSEGLPFSASTTAQLRRLLANQRRAEPGRDPVAHIALVSLHRIGRLSYCQWRVVRSLNMYIEDADLTAIAIILHLYGNVTCFWEPNSRLRIRLPRWKKNGFSLLLNPI